MISLGGFFPTVFGSKKKITEENTNKMNHKEIIFSEKRKRQNNYLLEDTSNTTVVIESHKKCLAAYTKRQHCVWVHANSNKRTRPMRTMSLV
jgi:hypothetical protein